MIELSGISKTFNQGRANEVKSLQNINLSIKEAEFAIVIGANGSGKSTLLSTLAGNIYPTEGNIKIDNRLVTLLPDFKRSKWIARVFQDPLSGTAPDLSILENFRLASLRSTSKTLKIGINDNFKNAVKEKISVLGMGLENKLDQPMGTLTGGQRQALTLLMCVMDDLKILLLDEPTAALDPRSAELVMTTANKLIQDYSLTAVMVTHNIKEAWKYGTRLIQMEDGSIKRDIPLEQKKSLQTTEIYEWFM